MPTYHPKDFTPDGSLKPGGMYYVWQYEQVPDEYDPEEMIEVIGKRAPAVAFVRKDETTITFNAGTISGFAAADQVFDKTKGVTIYDPDGEDPEVARAVIVDIVGGMGGGRRIRRGSKSRRRRRKTRTRKMRRYARSRKSM